MNAATTQPAPTPGYIPQWTFADRIRKVRRETGRTIEQMAVAIGVGDKRYAAWETGRNTPSNLPEVAVKLEKLTGVPRTWFLGWADENGPASEETGPKLELVHPLGLEPRTHWLTVAETKQNAPRNRARRNTHPKGRAR